MLAWNIFKYKLKQVKLSNSILYFGSYVIQRVPSICDTQGFLKVVIPDELHGSITWRTLPVRANMITRDVCE